MRCRLLTLCSMRPAATSSTSASAVSPTINRLRTLSPRTPRAIDPAPLAFIVVTMSEREACHAGSSPKSTAVRPATATVKSERGQIEIDEAHAHTRQAERLAAQDDARLWHQRAGEPDARRRRLPSPARAPAPARIRLSVRN